MKKKHLREARRKEREAYRQVEADLLERDDSHLWPIRGRFNATKRAIGRVKRAMRAGLCIESPADYLATLEAEISEIVNDPRLIKG